MSEISTGLILREPAQQLSNYFKVLVEHPREMAEAHTLFTKTQIMQGADQFIKGKEIAASMKPSFFENLKKMIAPLFTGKSPVQSALGIGAAAGLLNNIFFSSEGSTLGRILSLGADGLSAAAFFTGNPLFIGAAIGYSAFRAAQYLLFEDGLMNKAVGLLYAASAFPVLGAGKAVFDAIKLGTTKSLSDTVTREAIKFYGGAKVVRKLTNAFKIVKNLFTKNGATEAGKGITKHFSNFLGWIKNLWNGAGKPAEAAVETVVDVGRTYTQQTSGLFIPA